jgi:mannose-6-phosphate isomerase-like protein (cupin superfamily)
MTDSWQSSRAAIEQKLADLPALEQFHYPIRHGTMRVGLYAPRGRDDQTPHEQDELYIIASGNGWFVRGTERTRIQRDDVIFVPAGMLHRFESFSDDFAAWVVFWGPLGGESESVP